MDITINQEQLTSLLGNATGFIGAAGPKLEKLASFEDGLSDFAKTAADKLAQVGLIKTEDIPSVSQEIELGGFGKVKEAFDLVARGVDTLGKTASVLNKEQRTLTADEVWNNAWGISVPA